MPGANDPALATLLLPFAGGMLALPPAGRILFLGARTSTAMAALLPHDRTACRQDFRPEADALGKAGFTVGTSEHEATGSAALVLVLPPRQREAARFFLASAVMAAGAVVLAAAANNEGARSLADDLVRIAGPVEHLAKNKCRAFWAKVDPARLDRARIGDWLAHGEPRPVAGGRFLSRPGLFAWDHIDPGSALLAQCLPADLGGRGADLGCGFGVLAAAVLARGTAITALDLYDAERGAVDLARRNLEGSAMKLDFLWHDVTRGLPRRYDFIVSNPPFHAGRTNRAALGQAFIAAAAKALLPGGRLLLVANRHLPYEATLAEHFGTRVRVLREAIGYKVIEAVKAT
jgi:16S rRNA (guanine1207-N2)-methyltransferase